MRRILRGGLGIERCLQVSRAILRFRLRVVDGLTRVHRKETAVEAGSEMRMDDVNG